MVMDATPSPQSVGREFVRQYYTLLNKAPDHLHRFYNTCSSFVHGGLDREVVIGQKQIHTKIQQLNFRDCHAKISQVDAQSTLGNGVVVQVTGELSNDGQPMRRFTQTFVLGSQSPKKYYVHNDIFRYQDLYSDEEADGESRSDNDDEPEPENVVTDNQANLAAVQQLPSQQQQQPPPQQQQQPPQQQQQPMYYPISVAPATAQPVGIQSFGQPPPMNGVGHEEMLQTIAGQTANVIVPTASVVVPQQPYQQLTQPPSNQQNQPALAQQLPQQQSVGQTITNLQNDAILPNAGGTQMTDTIDIPQSNISDNATQLELSHGSHEIELNVDDNRTMEEPIRDIEVSKQSQISNEPKTYANLFKSEGSAISYASTMSNNNSTRVNTSGYVAKVPDSQLDNSSRVIASVKPTLRGASSYNVDRRPSNAGQYSDVNQLFVGNVPHSTTEDELRRIFSRFGAIVDIRINGKGGTKAMGNRTPPLFGFVTFEDAESVIHCLDQQEREPIMYPENSPNGTKLNVEKKIRRSSEATGGPSMGSRTIQPGGPSGNVSGSGNNNGNGYRMGGGNGGSGSGGPNMSRGGPNTGSGMIRSGPPGGGVSRGGPGGSSGGNSRGGFNRSDNRGPMSRGGTGPSNLSGTGSNYGRR